MTNDDMDFMWRDCHGDYKAFARRIEARILTEVGKDAEPVADEITFLVRKDTPEYREYIEARFGEAKSGYDTFRFHEHNWRYRYSSFDDEGDFDILFRLAPQRTAQADEQRSDSRTDRDRAIREHEAAPQSDTPTPRTEKKRFFTGLRRGPWNDNLELGPYYKIPCTELHSFEEDHAELRAALDRMERGYYGDEVCDKAERCKTAEAALEAIKPELRAIRECAEAAEARVRELRDRLAEIREVWAGSEVGKPVHAQEAYAIRLCKQMYQLACEALKP